MGHQIIQQPDGQLAVWSNNVDDWVIVDATKDELVEHYAEQVAQDARRRVGTAVDAVLEGRAREAYYQFTMTFDEAQRKRAEIHGSAPWPPEKAEVQR